MFKYDSKFNTWCNTYCVIYILVSNFKHMMVIFESISAGLSISLINNYILNDKILDQRMQ